jgi:hypothetical protein
MKNQTIRNLINFLESEKALECVTFCELKLPKEQNTPITTPLEETLFSRDIYLIGPSVRPGYSFHMARNIKEG